MFGGGKQRQVTKLRTDIVGGKFPIIHAFKIAFISPGRISGCLTVGIGEVSITYKVHSLTRMKLHLPSIRHRTEHIAKFAIATNVGGKLTGEKGVQFGDSFADGLTGFGGMVDEDGNGWLESLSLRRFLEVPELRYNRVEIQIGNKWNAPGGGIVEQCIPDLDSDGNPLMTGTVILHLEDGEIGTVAIDDICMGIFHDGYTQSNNSTADYDDSIGNFHFAGFYTAYFITELHTFLSCQLSTDIQGIWCTVSFRLTKKFLQ